jgi:hypothetical protein
MSGTGGAFFRGRKTATLKAFSFGTCKATKRARHTAQELQRKSKS